MSDVIQFPKKGGFDEEELKQAAKELEQVQVQRKAGLEGLRDRVKYLLDNEKINATHMSPASVEAFRDAISAMNYVLSSVEAQDTMIDMMTHDIIGLVQNVEALSNHLFQTSAFTQTLLETLKEKGVVSAEDMKKTWDKMVKAKNEVSQE